MNTTTKNKWSKRKKTSHTAQKTAVYHVPQSLAELKPSRQPPPGKTAMETIQGQWPCEESTEQLLAQLKALK